jgi:multiple sugar transport system permease protein
MAVALQTDRTRPAGRWARLKHSDAFWAVLLLLPNFVLVFLFTLAPTAAGLVLSFTEWDIISPAKWAGVSNFTRLATDAEFWIALRNTLVYTVVSVPVCMALSLALALLLNLRLPGTTIYRTVLFIPVVMSGVLVSLTWRWLFNPDYGPINYVLSLVGIRGPNWLSDLHWALPAIMIVTVWKNLGYNMVVFLAALQDVPGEYYDAAKIDGANAWREFLYITWPLISPATFFAFIVAMIGSFQVFDIVYMMTRGGPGRATSVMVQYIYENAFQYFKMGYAAAVAMVFFAFILILSLVQWYLRRRWVYGEG